MLRQGSNRNLKPISREKSKTHIQIPQNKPHQSGNRSSKVQSYHHHLSNNHSKTPKNDSKHKNSKGSNQTGKTKQIHTNKNSPDNHAIHMKGNLKQLMSKNTAPKAKNGDFVPDLLKNIEKHCKELKKIHQKQQKVSDKRASLQENKVYKGGRLSACNHSQEIQSKKKKERIKEVPIQMLQPEENRYSLQINQQPQKQVVPEPFTNERLAQKPLKNSDNTKNFIQLFKIYKKSFQIEDVKIGKSNKNTNYNTNQSKNSSSLFNSHGYSAFGQYNNRNKVRLDDKTNLGNIQHLIKSQQSSISRENSSGKKEVQKPAFHGQKIEIDRPVSKKVEERQLQKDVSLEIQEGLECKIECDGPELVKKWLPLKEVENPHFENINNEHLQSKNSRQSSGKKEVGCLQRKFQNSKYYVAQLPKFKPKKKEQQKKEEDSLAGCEITLIENNVICEDDEISLEL